MDILKTLIVYMVMVANGAVVASGATPIPYDMLHTPTPYMTPTPTPAPTLAPTLAPAAATHTPAVSAYQGQHGHQRAQSAGAADRAGLPQRRGGRHLWQGD